MAKVWWGEQQIAVGRAARFRLGTLTVWVAHAEDFWSLAWARCGAGDDATFRAECEFNEVDQHPEVRRFLGRWPTDAVTLRPRLPDRPVVTRPREPTLLPAGQRTKVYVSTPLWLELRLGAPGVVLTELPLSQPWGTWFGPSPMSGELCYVNDTRFVVDPEQLGRGEARAFTAATIVNESAETLAVEQFKTPVRELALFEATPGRLWTQDVGITRASDLSVSIETERRAPSGLTGARLVADARAPVAGEQNVLHKALGHFFGGTST